MASRQSSRVPGGVDRLQLHVGGFGGRLIGGVSVESADKVEGIVFGDVIVENDAAEDEGEEGEQNLKSGLTALDVIVRQQTAADNVFFLGQGPVQSAIGTVLMPPTLLAEAQVKDPHSHTGITL